jgi:multidrug efflux pump subunit AcrB
MIAWFARNSVAANLLMVLVICAGAHAIMNRLVLEVLPEFESEVVRVQVSYRGATPSGIEEGILIKIEEAIQDLQGIEELRSSASEGSGTVSIEVEKGTDPRILLDDVKGRVDAISTFPEEVERPIYSIPVRRREVIGVVVSGDFPEHELRTLGERVRNELLALKGVTQVELTEIRPYEISIEVSEESLERYGLTFAELSRAVASSSLDLPAGSLKTNGGEIRLRTKGQLYTGADFGRLVILRNPDGSGVTLNEVAKINVGFEEEPIEARFNGKPCVILEVYRVGMQNAIQLSQTVRDYIDNAQLSPGVELTYWRDRSIIIEKRLNTLYVNAGQGALLVVLILGLFLRPSVALWVCLGIPVSFLGALAVMPSLGITINLLSVFAFILVLGIVVDDAIVTGENIYTHIRRGGDPTQAAIAGAHGAFGAGF